MGVFIETMENVGDDEWRCSICEGARGSLSVVTLHLKEVHDIAPARMWVEDDPDWPPVPRMEDRKPVPDDRTYGDYISFLGRTHIVRSMEVSESAGRIVAKMECIGLSASPTEERQWIIFDMARGRARELRHELSKAIRKHQEAWF